jgi:hypothetical protein
MQHMVYILLFDIEFFLGKIVISSTEIWMDYLEPLTKGYWLMQVFVKHFLKKKIILETMPIILRGGVEDLMVSLNFLLW